MEIAKRKRRVIRAQATRIINEADDILAKQQATDIVAVSGLIERLLLVQNQLSDVNAAIEPHILEEDADAEFEQAMEYDDKIASCLGSMKSFGKTGSATEHQTALTTLLRYFRRELESQERALEHRTDNSIGKPAFYYDREKVKPQRSNCRPSSAAALHGSAANVACEICGSTDHESKECNSDLDLAEKKSIPSAKGICFRCTKKGHIARECRVRIACKRCNRRHATSMCNPAFASGQKEDTETRPKEQVSLHASGADTGGTKQTVLMPTVTAWNKGTKTKMLSRILFDSGSQRTFITEECSRKLGCKLLGTEILTVGVFGGQQKPDSFRRVEVRLLSKDNCKEEYVFDALEVPTICEQVIPCPDEQVKETLRELSLPLGDNSIEQDAAIDVLIGSDQFWECLTRRIRKINSKLTAMETVFGWAVQGPTVSKCKAVNCAQVVVLRSSVTDQQTEPIPRLFSELEGVGVSDTPEKLPDVQIMEQFTKGNKTVDGRYEVRLPEREDVAVGDNRSVSEETWHIEQQFENFMPDGLDQRGRICSLNVTHDERHPLVLPMQHRHTKLLVHRAHRQLLHAGVKDISCNCPEAIEASTGILPPDRTTQADPLEVVGIDFARTLVKIALKEAVGRQGLDFVELSTVPAEVEAVINFRLLTGVQDDPNDGALLTRASFFDRQTSHGSSG
ncbi:hypothetical protein HPB50_010194 [Hyalomma asiaticum]|uniref:Uncharacterized protein n=1 Tax=Hyalomma asiaticum TaxID=266040 RepID=A0ACB7SD11_HYAAI|nr:hypothetical protein HPB50_010194 [Hyalomma asiaticum]